MAERVGTYSARGFLSATAFSVAVMALSGWLLYLSAPERLTCERTADGPALCRLERRVVGIVVRDRSLGRVQGASVESSTPVAPRVGERPRTQASTHWVRYATDTGWVEGVQGESHHEQAALAKGLTAFLADRQARRFEAAVGGQGPAARYLPWAFGAGASILPLWLVGHLFPATRPNRRR
jgi:hypothetical protein